jgi:3-oxoacyl-(acyl-carrier-protein) synthase
MKGQIGHLIASCTAVELLGVIHSIQKQEVLPTLNFEESDPEAPLFVVQQKPLSIPVRYVLKLNSAFGGHNTALIIKKHTKD